MNDTCQLGDLTPGRRFFVEATEYVVTDGGNGVFTVCLELVGGKLKNFGNSTKMIAHADGSVYVAA